MESISVNIFTAYKQEENNFTNGLLSILRLASLQDAGFIKRFLAEELSIQGTGGIDSFRVLQGIDNSGTVDGQISGTNCCIWIETKIASASLDEDQIIQHLQRLSSDQQKLSCDQQKLKKLVLLTPDDTRSQYIRKFVNLDAEQIVHLEWRRVYKYLDEYANTTSNVLLKNLISQFLDRTRSRIFEQDMAGIIAKISFGENSGVSEHTYIDEMKRGLWNAWRTPSKYKNLDGTGRKLLLYDRTRKAITLEVEIKSVKKTDEEIGYPWSNIFADGTLKVYEQAIPLSKIQSMPGFEYFGKSRSPYRNLTREQYRNLVENCIAIEPIVDSHNKPTKLEHPEPA